MKTKPVPKGFLPKYFIEAILKHKDNSCLIWPQVEKHQYGEVRIETFNLRIHRLAYILFKGPIPPGYDVCHTCDKRPCFNLKHLVLGTRQDNMQDASKKGRMHHGRNNKTKITREGVLAMRMLWKTRDRSWGDAGKMLLILSKKFKVPPSLVKAIVYERLYKQIT